MCTGVGGRGVKRGCEGAGFCSFWAGEGCWYWTGPLRPVPTLRSNAKAFLSSREQTLCQECNFQSGSPLRSMQPSLSLCSSNLPAFQASPPQYLPLFFFLLDSSCLHQLRWAQPWEESPATCERWTPRVLCLFCSTWPPLLSVPSVHFSSCLKEQHPFFIFHFQNRAKWPPDTFAFLVLN